MPPISPDRQAALLAALSRHDVPVNALARVLSVSTTTLQRWLSGRNAMPPAAAELLEALVRFRDGANPPT